MRPAFILATTLAAAALPAAALDITGNVLDKMGAPIPGAKVCVKSDAGTCVNTGSSGEFHIQKGTAIRPREMGFRGFDLGYRNGSLVLTAPAAATARLEWLAPDGRRQWAASDLRLSAGRNIVPVPRALPHAGLALVRLTTSGGSLSWKAVLADGARAASGQAVAPRILAVSKAAVGGATLEVSKTGYRTRTYEPASEVETDAVIFLSATDDVGLAFGGTLNLKVVSIDHAKKQLITESVDASCDSTDKVVRDTSRDTSSYVIRDGKLWTWTPGECTGQMFTGSGTDIVGKWTLVDANAELPDDLKAGCVPDSSGSDPSPFDSFTADYTVGETQVTAVVSAEICPADLYGPLLAVLFADDSSVTLAKNTCKQVVFKNGKGENGTLDFTKKGDSLLISFGYKTTTCALGQDFSFTPNDPVCPEQDDVPTFMACVAGSGFADLPPAIKRSAAAPLPPMSLERSIPGWRPLSSRDPMAAWRATRAATLRAMSMFSKDGRRNAR